MKYEPTGYWIFFCNPKRWNIDEFLRTDPDIAPYLITPSQKDMFCAGQKGIIRVAIDKRSDRKIHLPSGIYAIVEVISQPHFNGSFQMSFWNEEETKISERLCVDLKILRNLIEKPILISSLRKNPEIDDEYLFNGGYGFYSSAPLTKKSFEIVNFLASR